MAHLRAEVSLSQYQVPNEVSMTNGGVGEDGQF
jgi:hypothetical protein